MSESKTFRVAVTQHEPVWLDLNATVNKTCDIIKEAAEKGAKLVAFSECFIPGYPAWIWSRPVDFDLGTAYIENSLPIDSPQFERIKSTAAENGIAVSLGFSERDGESVYIAQALIDETGELKMKRRKMKPTHMERTIFGDASGDCLAEVVQIGTKSIPSNDGEVTSTAGTGVKVGSLSCWEHIQPLLKYYTLAQGEQIHVAAWPVLDPFIEGSPGFWSMTVQGCLGLSQTYACESQAFVLHSTQIITEEGIKKLGTTGSPLMGTPTVGSSAVIGPDGRVLSAADPKNEELIIADLDLQLVTKTRSFADAGGHYSRPDLMWLGVDRGKKGVVRIA